jgi:hypothetical protein
MTRARLDDVIPSMRPTASSRRGLLPRLVPTGTNCQVLRRGEERDATRSGHIGGTSNSRRPPNGRSRAGGYGL